MLDCFEMLWLERLCSGTSGAIPLQGLSHYLEHMLFMGSEKFPDENDYDAYLASSGGASNAYTELVHG
jgi:Insulinase (Peptidase family M16)